MYNIGVAKYQSAEHVTIFQLYLVPILNSVAHSQNSLQTSGVISSYFIIIFQK